jgi:hypothetical protein
MNREDMIRMAREAAVAGVTVWSEEEQADVLHPDLAHFAALVAAAEREACAKVCDAGIGICADINDQWDFACINRAAAIRARGQHD